MDAQIQSVFCILVYSVKNLREGSRRFATIPCFDFFFKGFCWHICNHKCHMFCSGFAFWLEMYRICHQLFLKINTISVKTAESQLETYIIYEIDYPEHGYGDYCAELS